MKKFVVFLIKKYQKTLSLDTGWFRSQTSFVCVFYPTCSEYTLQSVEKYGVIKGMYKGCKRVLRCTPWQKQHIDEV